MKSGINNIILAVLSTALVLATAGCGAERQADRQVIERQDKQITVLEQPAPGTKGEVVVERLLEVPDVRGMDWLDEETILASKANTDRTPLVLEGNTRYPVNLILHDLTDQEQTVLLPSDRDQDAGMLSPDKKHLFFKLMEESLGFGYLRNMETGKVLPVTESQGPDDLILGYEGNWIDSEHVLFPTMSGKIYLADVYGQTEVAADTEDLTVSDVHLFGDRLYYIRGQQLYVQEGDEAPQLLDDQAIWVIPSPDQQSLALVNRTREREMQLSITDLEGREKFGLSKAVQIFGAAWSRDGTRLAYNLINPDKGTSGLFVADVVTGKVTQVTIELESLSNRLQWSPSGDQLMAAAFVRKGNSNEPVTYIITLRS
ncbi:TolB family protein [Paenibacillus sp. 1P07SE]|uniref:TolB family protein n=1 Tax=Paenibacillus sp. 1P07SE TaxID=3132209 RepID=UPI0039A4849A